MKLIKNHNIQPNEWDKQRKTTAFNNEINLNSLVISELWNMNDVIHVAYKDLDFALSQMQHKDRVKMKKGLTKVAMELENIAKELRNYCDDKLEEIEII